MRTVAIIFALAVVLGLPACSIDDSSESGQRPEVDNTSTTLRTTSGSDVATTLTPSIGFVQFDGRSHEFDATCHAPGAAEVLAIGSTMSDGGRIEVYLQAFLGAPYLGISVTDEQTVVYEAAIDRPLDISYENDVLRVDDVVLVTDLDLETGAGTDAGLGSIVVECRSYQRDLPPGFVER